MPDARMLMSRLQHQAGAASVVAGEGAYHGLQLHRLIAEERPDAACRAIAVFHKRVADRLIDRSFTSNPLPAAIHGSQQNPSHR